MKISPKVKVRKKPCKRLGYCPYGGLVEEFPSHELEIDKAVEMGWYVRYTRDKGWVECSKDTPGVKPNIIKVIEKFGVLDNRICNAFGHRCPVFELAESMDKVDINRA